MSIQYGVTFIMLAAAATLAGVFLWAGYPIVASLSVFSAISFLLLAIAYLGAGPGLLMKQRNGRLRLLSWLLFGPYLLLSTFSFWIYRIGSKERPYVQVIQGLYFGRRLTNAEVSSAKAVGWTAVLDLACEFSEVSGLRNVARYYSLPILDATAPGLAHLRQAVGFLADTVPSGRVYVHCALGHGRSATIVMAYLLAVGEVADIRSGLARLRSLRPQVKLHRAQIDLLRSFTRES
jgi:hypothetical protein